jgi:hypothetical protein
VTRFWKAVGVALQILVLGELLFAALVVMYVTEPGERIFRYAGF